MTRAAATGGTDAAPLRVALVSTGDELLRGRSRDGNAPWMATRLDEAGFAVTGHRLVGDDRRAQVAAVRAAAREADAVVVTGGLGPTPDDHARHVAARLLRTPLVEHAPTLRRLRARWRDRERAMPAVNRVQASFPDGAAVVPNPTGTAPGLRFAVGDALVLWLPGVPREMEVMFRRSVLPALRRRRGGGGRSTVRHLTAFGLAESELVERLGDLFPSGGEPSVGTSVDEGVITVSVHGRGPAARRVAALQRAIRDRLEGHVVAMERLPLGTAVTARLRAVGLTAAAAESCTGGLVARRLTDAAGASEVFRGGVVAYANEAKTGVLGVSRALLDRHGAVSGPVAEAMARGARRRFGTDLAVAVTGIAGPGGGTKAKPVGLVWFGIATAGGTRSLKRRFPGNRAFVRGLAANTALDLLRREADRVAAGGAIR